MAAIRLKVKIRFQVYLSRLLCFYQQAYCIFSCVTVVLQKVAE